MLWSASKAYAEEPFETESELEAAINEAARAIFSSSRIYLDVKKKIGTKGKTQNIPDGYLIDLASTKDPRLLVVEVELAKLDPLKHIAVQILEFSLSFETSPQVVKNAVKGALLTNPTATTECQNYAASYGFDNLDYLLEKMIYGTDRFNALVIIDELPDELETVLISRFKFPVEILTIQRYASSTGEILYKFDPFLEDVGRELRAAVETGRRGDVDISGIDTIVVPAREEGFKETFLGQNCWYAIRIHATMLSRIRYIAAYRVAPESAVTQIAAVESIKQWKDTNKYILNFAAPAEPIGPIALLPKGKVKAPQGPRYTTRSSLVQAKTLDEAF